LKSATLIFTIGDIDSVLNSATREPFIQQIYNAANSLGGTKAMVVVVIILLTVSATTKVATASRQI
jgi:choline transport protein